MDSADQGIRVFLKREAIIANNLPVVSEIDRNQVNGLLVPPENVTLLSKAAIYLVKPDDLGSKMGKKGKELTLERYTWSKIAQELKKIYDKTLTRTVM